MKKLKKFVNRQNLLILGIFLISAILVIGLVTTTQQRQDYLKNFKVFGSSTRTHTDLESTSYDYEAYQEAKDDYEKRLVEYKKELEKIYVEKCGPEVGDIKSGSTEKEALDNLTAKSKRRQCTKKLKLNDLKEYGTGKPIVLPAIPSVPQKSTYTDICNKVVTERTYMLLGFNFYTATSEKKIGC